MNLGIFTKTLIFGLLFLILHLYFFSEVTSYFSQDDFFHLTTVMEKRILDLPQFFYKLSDDYAFYRPVSRELYNFLTLKIFNLNPLPYHFINLILIMMNGFLGIKFFLALRNRLDNWVFKTIFLTLYLLSAVHSVELYYLSSVQTLLAAFFVLLSLNFFFEKRVLSLFFFSLGIMSHESSVILLPILFILLLLCLERNLVKGLLISTKVLFPFILVSLLRLIIQLSGFGMDTSTTYSPSFSLQTILNTLLWYILWSFGMPEMLVDFATFRLQFNPNLFKYYGFFTVTVFPAFILMTVCLSLILFKTRRFIQDKTFIFLCLSYLSSLLPLVFFPTHKFVYYLSFPLVIFTGILSYICFEFASIKSKIKLVVLVFLFAYVLISYQTLQINKITYWAAKRANSANYLLKDIKNKFGTVPKGGVVYIKNDPNYPFISKEWGSSSKQAFYILSGSDAFKLIFNDPNIKVYYEDVTGLPPGLDKLIVYEAHIPY